MAGGRYLRGECLAGGGCSVVVKGSDAGGGAGRRGVSGCGACLFLCPGGRGREADLCRPGGRGPSAGSLGRGLGRGTVREGAPRAWICFAGGGLSRASLGSGGAGGAGSSVLVAGHRDGGERGSELRGRAGDFVGDAGVGRGLGRLGRPVLGTLRRLVWIWSDEGVQARSIPGWRRAEGSRMALRCGSREVVVACRGRIRSRRPSCGCAGRDLFYEFVSWALLMGCCDAV